MYIIQHPLTREKSLWSSVFIQVPNKNMCRRHFCLSTCRKFTVETQTIILKFPRNSNFSCWPKHFSFISLSSTVLYIMDTVYSFEFAQSYFRPLETLDCLPSLEFVHSPILFCNPLYMYIIFKLAQFSIQPRVRGRKRRK